ncbi:MAG: 50S ribosomal protein L17, partial [Patescibacteria group bacterium]
MRHRKEGKKFGRLRGARASFLRNLSNDLVRAERVETTEARAKEIRPIVERLVTHAKRQTLASRRLILSRVNNKKITEKLMSNLGPRYLARA